MSSTHFRSREIQRQIHVWTITGTLFATLLGSVSCKNFSLAKQDNFRAKTKDGYVYILPVPDTAQGSGATGRTNWVEIHTKGDLSERDLRAVYQGNLPPNSTRLTQCAIPLTTFNAELSSDPGVAPQTRSAFFASMAIVSALASGVVTGKIVSSGLRAHKAELESLSKDLETAKFAKKSAQFEQKIDTDTVEYRAQMAAQNATQIKESKLKLDEKLTELTSARAEFETHQQTCHS